MQTLVPRSTLAAKPGMGTMKGLEQIGSRGFYRLAGAVTVQEGVELAQPPKLGDGTRRARVPAGRNRNSGGERERVA